jgi:hypothetical protein
MKHLLYQLFGYNYFTLTLTLIKMLLYAILIVYILENIYIRDLSIIDNINNLYKEYKYSIIKWTIIYLIIYYLIYKSNTSYWLDFSESFIGFIFPKKSFNLTNIFKDLLNIK